ncbi:MAG TPA: glycosyltransferase family 4 protein [Lacipirellulaceae bacterium]|jgi:glycosyltransferase involved in cell wall biosynthesis|nr:glycosyltransferase family 4 protein [Lacipirellulaceae bacterium]
MSELQNDIRPGLAIVTNSITPYHLNLQKLIAAGIPEFKIHVLISHWASDFQWNVEIPPELHLTRYGAVGEHPLENPLRRPIWGWHKGGRFIRYFREHDIRAAIIGGYRFISYARLMNYCYRAKIPFFVNTDANIRSEPNLSLVKKTGKRTIYSWWTKRVSGVFSMGELGDQFFIKYGVDPNHLYRVPYWPDFDAYAHVGEDELARFRQRFRLSGHRRYLMFSGRLVPVKRVDLLIDAFAKIAKERPDWDLLIVGDGVLRDELIRRVPEALRSRVVWTGFLEGRELAVAYHAADVLVLPSDHEPWALVVDEAMAAGLVVVASDIVGAAHELVTDGVSGRIFPAGDCHALLQSLLNVTRADRLDEFKAESKDALQAYQSEVNPVAEVRRALENVGVLSPTAAVNLQQAMR